MTKNRRKTNQFNLSRLFGSKYKNEEVFADWVDFEIVSPFGELIHHENYGYGAIYEYERDFFFEKGVLKKLQVYDNTKSVQSIYFDFEHSDTLLHFLYNNINWEALPKIDSDKKLKLYVSFEMDLIPLKGSNP